jgi:hypothetical protein
MRPRHFLVFACVALSSLHARANPPHEQAVEATAAQVRDFLERFIDPDSTPAEQTKFFTEDANYYGRGPVGMAEIEKDIIRHRRHWPSRAYQLLQIDYLSSDPATDTVFVSYTVGFYVENGRQTIRGTANYGAFIVDLDTWPRIVWVMEKITGRRDAGSGE